VGLAATFLVIPAYLVLLVLLAVSIIGIPVIIVAAPLYPVAVVVAVGFGLIAAAHALGERTAEQRTPTDIRYRNAYAYLFTGVGLLLAPMLIGYLVGMTGFLGFVRVLLLILGWAAVGTAAMVGLGAVVLSRAGTRRFFAERFDDTLFEPDPLLDNEPAGLGRHA
jgi:MFS family permease